MGPTLQNVESVIYDSINKVYYASCGNQYKPGKDGFIARLSHEGVVLDTQWIRDLNRPTGMALRDNQLFVADVNRLLVIDVNKARVIDSIPEVKINSGLNDVALTVEGNVFVTASFIHAVLQLKDGSLEIFAQDNDLLEWANGIMVDGENLIVGGTHLIKIDIRSKEKSVLSITPKVYDFDGLVADNTGGFFASTVENSALWHINEAMEATQIASDSSYFGDMDYLPVEKLLVIARGNSATNSYHIEARDMKD